MSPESPSQAPRRSLFLWFWGAGLGLLFLITGALAFSIVVSEKHAANRNHILRMGAHTLEAGKTPPDPLPANTDFTSVKVGIYLEGVENFSIKESAWTATFYIWFTWKGDPRLDPGTTFQVVDAKIEKKQLLESGSGLDGTHYQRYKVIARVSKFFNTTRVPLDDHMLNIYIEDSAHDGSKLRYVTDPTSNVSSRVKIPGYSISHPASVVKAHTYKTSYGDPRVPNAQHTTFSEYVFAVDVRRNSGGVYMKLFVGLFTGVLLTLASFFLGASTPPRFGITCTAYFGAVANAYLVSSGLPSGGQFGLADLVTSIGLLTIMISAACSIISAHYYLNPGDKGFARRLDLVSCATIGTGFLVINILLPLAAYSA